LKNLSSSTFAVSSESEAWIMFPSIVKPKSPLIDPGRASAGLVAQVRVLIVAIALIPDTANATTGVLFMYFCIDGKKGLSAKKS
jgi:hypothetical protein